MNGFLLDTHVISELIKSEPNGNVLRWIDETDETILFLSVLTIGEIRNGIERPIPASDAGNWSHGSMWIYAVGFMSAS